jgi:hypothetical protein
MTEIATIVALLQIPDNWPLKLFRSTSNEHSQLELVVQQAFEAVVGKGMVVPQAVVERPGFEHTIDLEVVTNGKKIAVEIFATQQLYIGSMVKNNVARLMSIIGNYDGGLIVYNANTHLDEKWADLVHQKTNGKVKLVPIQELPTLLKTPSFGF